MENNQQPTLGNGKICYIEIPAIDVNTSAAFYKEVFGWRIRQRGDGHLAFDDTVGQVSGTWIVGRKPSTEPGLLIYIMVDSVAAASTPSLPMAARLCNRSAWTHQKSPQDLATRREMCSASISNRLVQTDRRNLEGTNRDRFGESLKPGA